MRETGTAHPLIDGVRRASAAAAPSGQVASIEVAVGGAGGTVQRGVGAGRPRRVGGESVRELIVEGRAAARPSRNTAP